MNVYGDCRQLNSRDFVVFCFLSKHRCSCEMLRNSRNTGDNKFCWSICNNQIHHFEAFFGTTYALGLFCSIQRVNPSPIISFKFAAAASCAASYPTESDTIISHPITHNDIYPKKSTFFWCLLQMNELQIWNPHWMLTIFDLIVRDRADRSGCSNHQFDQSDSVKKIILALFGTLVSPGGKFFRTVRKTVDRWWFS